MNDDEAAKVRRELRELGVAARKAGLALPEAASVLRAIVETERSLARRLREIPAEAVQSDGAVQDLKRFG